MSSSLQSSMHYSPSTSADLSSAQLPVDAGGTRAPSLSVGAAASRSGPLSPSIAKQPHTHTASQSQSSPSTSVALSSGSRRGPSPPSAVQRLSSSLHRSPLIQAVTRTFAARLAGSFTASPVSTTKQLRVHANIVSVSRVDKASVLRSDPNSQHAGSMRRAQGLTSPSHVLSSHAVSHIASQQRGNTHSRQVSTDHSNLQISAIAPSPMRLSTHPDDGPTLRPQPASIDEEAPASPQVEVSRGLVSRGSAGSSVSSRQNEIEQAAQRLRSLDQEIMHRKPSVVLQPVKTRLTQALPELQPSPEQQAEDERVRGRTIDTPPAYTIALDEYQDTPSPSTNLHPIAIPYADTSAPPPTDLSDPVDADTDPASYDPAAPPAATGCGAIVAGTISSFIFSIVYLPFTVAILSQSVVQRRPILPINWQTELTPPYWLFSFALFGFLFCFPFVLVFGLMEDTGIWSVFNNNVRSAIPFTMFFALYLSLFVMLHVATVLYAHIRVDLSVIHSKTRQFHFTLWTLLYTAAIVFEAFQLISPFTSVASLGLHTSTASSDSAAERTYHSWLGSMASVFGVGEWQVADINTFLETFWIAFAVIIFYAFALGYGIQSNMQPSHMAAPVLFEVIPGTLYLSIVGRLFRIFDCDIADDGTYHLNGDSSIECWNNFQHRSMCMSAFMGLLFYSSSAMFVACYRGDASSADDVKFKPVYLVLERTLRDLFAMTTSLISNQLLSRALSYPILIVLTFATYRMRPCSIPTLTRMKVLAQASAVWLLTLSFLADMFRGATDWFDLYVPAMLVWGWVAGVGAYLLYEAWCYWRRWQRRQMRRRTVAVNGSAALQGLQLADDDDDSEVEVAIKLGTLDSPHAIKETQVVIQAAFELPDKPSEPKLPAAVAINVSLSASPSISGPRIDAVSAFTAPTNTTPTSPVRAFNIRQQAIRHTQTAMMADGRRDSVSAQPNVVGSQQCVEWSDPMTAVAGMCEARGSHCRS